MAAAPTIYPELIAAPHSFEPIPYDNYFVHPGYHTPDYTHEYGEVLPGADFNKHVYEFDGDHNIWDQNDYEERVKVEAEMLVALEALKESVMYLGYDINDVQDRINQQMGRVRHNQDHIYENMTTQQTVFGETYHRVEHLGETARYTQMDLDTNKYALVLYCQ